MGAKYASSVSVCLSVSLSVCVFVCLPVCLSTPISQKTHIQISPEHLVKILTNFLYIVARSCSDGSAICYVLLVLCISDH